LAKAGTTVFLSTHSISVAEEVCHRIGIIQKGHLIAGGSMADIYRLTRGHDSNLEDVFLELTQQQDDLALPRERPL
jgi:ABC-2 type transport system ATP-binding protein